MLRHVPTWEYPWHLYFSGVSDEMAKKREWSKKRETARSAFGRALDELLATKRVSQTELARRYAEAAGGKITPSKVSDWIRGESLPEDGDAEAVFLVERLLGAPRGSLARHLGYVPLDTQGCTVEVAIDSDPLLGDRERFLMHAQYKALLASRGDR